MGKRIAEAVKYLFDAILSVVYPNEEKCIVCGEYIEEGNICVKCRDNIKMCSEALVVNRENFKLTCCSVSYYANIMRDLILRLKYKSDFQAGEIISQLMIKYIKKQNIRFDLVTFIPMTKKALRKRGYNQSKFLAKLVSRHFKVPLVSCVKKVSETGDQIGLDEYSRWENLSHCFKSSAQNKFFQKEVLIIDDVITTGATAFYCAKEIYSGGCKRVIVLTAAKSRI